MTLTEDKVVGDDTPIRASRAMSAIPGLPGGLHLNVTSPASRMGWSLACILLVTFAIQVWSGSYQFSGGALLSVALFPVAFFCMLRCWTDPVGPSGRLQLIIMIALAVAIMDNTVIQIVQQPYYGTDAVAFGQYAAELVAKGQNPYTHSMMPSLAEFHVPTIFGTHFLDGTVMDKVSYPSGNFIPYVPFLMLGWHTQTAVIINVVFWLISGFLMWRLLPTNIRFIAPVMMTVTGYVLQSIGGVNDTIYLPFLILAVWRWDRFADPVERSAARWLGPIAIGVAMTVKQTPWFLFPFLLIGVTLESRWRNGTIQWKVPARYTAIAGAVFLVINAPWIIADPMAWWNGSVAPLTASFVPMGQGLVNLTLAQQLGGGNLSMYTVSGALWVLLCLLAMAFRYRQMKRIWPVLIIVSFFFTPRSLGNYLSMMLPAALVAAVTVRTPTPVDESQSSRKPLARFATPMLALVLAGSLGAAILALVVPSPVSLKIESTVTNGQKMSVTDVTVTLTNHTDSTQRPHFTVNRNGYITNFWYPAGSKTGDTSVTLAPHATRRVTLHAPDIASMPGTTEPFKVYAYTDKPNTISSSATYRQSTTTVTLTPQAVGVPVAVGDEVIFTAQLTDRLNREVHKAGVQVGIGQVIYASAGLLGGDASIQGQAEGVTPGYAITDEQGRAHFTIIGRHASMMPTYFQAWVPGTNSNPSGYSNIVNVQFYDR